MAKVKVKMPTIFKRFEPELRSQMRALQKETGDLIIEEMKSAISKGLSPVRGFGRFVGYKDKEKYPGKKKASKPVNLYLTGEMLDHLDYEIVNLDTIRVDIMNANSDVLDRAKAHQNGTKFLPQRKFMPTNRNEEFILTIQRRISDVREAFFSKFIRKLNK